MNSEGRPEIAFSTLACPEWPALEVVLHASAAGYDAIEWRGGPDGHVQPAWPAVARLELRRALESSGVKSLAVTAYTSFVSHDPAERAANAADLAAYVDLAGDLGARFVRAFIGTRTDAAPMSEIAARVSDSIVAVADRAHASGIAITLEPHDDFVEAGLVAEVLGHLDHPGVGAVWDIGNAWSIGELPGTTLTILGPWIRYMQLKDGAGVGPSWQLTGIGEGEVPLAAALRALRGRGPLPPLSLEWERAWHPELAPAVAILGPALQQLRRMVDDISLESLS